MVSMEDTVGGQYGAVYFIDESNYGVTPNAAAWDKRVAKVADFSPTFNPNIMPIPSAGSKRLVGHTSGAPWDIAFNLATIAWGDVWLEYWKLGLGSASGTGVPCADGDRVPPFSIFADVCRHTGGGSPAELRRGILYNGCKVSSLSIKKTHSPDPISVTLQGRCQYGQKNLGLSGGIPKFEGFQGTAGTPLTIASLGSLPDKDLPPVHYYHFKEEVQYDGGSLELMPRVAGWEFLVTQTLTPIPGQVVGADGLVYPVHKGFGEGGMEVLFKVDVTPENFDYYDAAVENRLPIPELRLSYTAPPGYSVGSKTFKLLNGKWETGDWSLKELVSMGQSLPAKFADVQIV